MNKPIYLFGTLICITLVALIIYSLIAPATITPYIPYISNRMYTTVANVMGPVLILVGLFLGNNWYYYNFTPEGRVDVLVEEYNNHIDEKYKYLVDIKRGVFGKDPNPSLAQISNVKNCVPFYAEYAPEGKKDLDKALKLLIDTYKNKYSDQTLEGLEDLERLIRNNIISVEDQAKIQEMLFPFAMSCFSLAGQELQNTGTGNRAAHIYNLCVMNLKKNKPDVVNTLIDVTKVPTAGPVGPNTLLANDCLEKSKSITRLNVVPSIVQKDGY